MALVESGRALERRDPHGESFSHWVIIMGTLLSFLLSFDTWLAFGPTYIFKEIIIGFLATAPKQYRQPTIDWNQLNYGPKWGFSLYKLTTSCMWSSNKQPADTVPSLQELLSVSVQLKRHATIRPCPAALLPISLLSHIKPAPGLLRLQLPECSISFLFPMPFSQDLWSCWEVPKEIQNTDVPSSGKHLWGIKAFYFCMQHLDMYVL